LTLQAGQWLTPYGIWNVDHGSPVIIGVQQPYIVGAKLLPSTQVGVLAQGSFGVAEDTEVGYALGISNGRTDISAYQDLDANKAITARLSLTYRGLGALTIGSTGYTGENSDTLEGIYFEGSEPHSRELIKMREHERALAFDLRWDYSNLRFQAEAIMNEH